MISLLTINVRGVSNKHCLLPFFITLRLEISDIETTDIIQGITKALIRLFGCSDLYALLV